MKYNKDQWISSYEDRIVRLRPYTSQRMLATMGLIAGNQFGAKDVDPAVAAEDYSKLLDAKARASR